MLIVSAAPYSYYFCTMCECKSLHWQFSDGKSCDTCGHRGMSHFCWWNREILKPIQKYGYEGEGADAYAKLGKLLRWAAGHVRIMPSNRLVL